MNRPRAAQRTWAARWNDRAAVGFTSLVPSVKFLATQRLGTGPITATDTTICLSISTESSADQAHTARACGSSRTVAP